MGGVLFSTIIATIVNFAILIAIIIVIYKSIQRFKNHVNRTKDMEKKLDIILNKLENKEEN